MTETVDRKKIEVLVDQPLAQRIVDIALKAGVKGYTLLPTLSGGGRTGTWRDDALSGAQSKVVFVAITTAAKATAMTDALAPLLESHGLVLFISDVQVVRAAHF